MKKVSILLVMLLCISANIFAQYFGAVNSDGKTIYYKIISSTEPRTVEVIDLASLVGDNEYKYSGVINIPESVTYDDDGNTYSVTIIGSSAFSHCTGLTSITIPNSVTSIGEYAFSGCTGLTSITIGNSVTSIDHYAFYGCSGLTTLNWNAKNCTSVGNYGNNSAFSNLTNLTQVNIGDSVEVLPLNFLYGCSGLTSVTIPNSVTSIGGYAFSGCSGLTTLNFNATNCTYVGPPSGSFGYYAFSDRTNLSTVNFGDSVQIIPEGLLYCCTGLTSVIIPNSVTSIGDYAFAGCSGLTSITIGNSVTSIEGYAFSRCSGLTSITIPNSVTSIGYATFRGCSGLTSVTIPNSVTSIGDYAFADCTGLTSITIPNSVTSIGYATFRGCSGLTSVTIPNSVTSIGDFAFDGCSGLTSITIPNSVTSIGDYAFAGCSGLTSITIPNSVTSIGEGAFSACSSLTSITIGNSVTSIGEEAFSQCPLDTLRMKPENPPTIEMHTIDRVADIFVPCGCEEVYKSAPNWKFFKDNIQEDCSAIEEVAEETGIAIYPNPVMDNAVLSIGNLKEDVKVILTDEQGRQVSLSTMKAGEREINLNTSSLANGIYFVRIVGETIQRTEKIIKK